MKVLVLADAHGNATALEAVLNQEQDFDYAIFLGDAISPGPQPNETIELLAQLNGVFIQGNHERSILHPESIEYWPDEFKVYMEWIHQGLSADGVEFLRTFETAGQFRVDNKDWLLMHGDEAKSVRHILPDSPDAIFREIVAAQSEIPVLFGHSHVQFSRRIGNQRFINPGSIGQNRCGQVVACYGLLTDGVFSHHHVDYDVAPVIEAIDRIQPLRKFEVFKEALKLQIRTGFSAGKIDPWLTLGKRGFI